MRKAPERRRVRPPRRQEAQHRPDAEHGTRRQKSERPSPAEGVLDNGYQPDSGHGKCEPHGELQSERSTNVRLIGEFSDERGELR